MTRAHNDGKETQGSTASLEESDLSGDDISISDLEIIPNETDEAENPIGPGLYLLANSNIESEATELDAPSDAPAGDASRGPTGEQPPVSLAGHFGPEVTAGIVIVALFVVFAVLMLLDVSNSAPATGEQEPTQTAPAEAIEVEIGEGVTLERE